MHTNNVGLAKCNSMNVCAVFVTYGKVLAGTSAPALLLIVGMEAMCGAGIIFQKWVKAGIIIVAIIIIAITIIFDILPNINRRFITSR